jgi:DSS1/SEM1 family
MSTKEESKQQPQVEATTATTTPSKKPGVVSLMETLEEDDAFEEFTAENWGNSAMEEETQQWVDNWDDDMDDDFTKNLRAELEQHSAK